MTTRRAAPLARRLGPVLAIAVLGLATVALHRLGHGPLAAPSECSLDGISAWAAQRDAATTAVAVLRVAALVLAWQQVVAVGLGLVGRALRLPALVRAAAVATLPGLRRATVGAATVALSVSSVLAVPGVAGAAPPSPAPPGTVSIEQVEAVPTTATLQLLGGEQPTAPGEATFTRVDSPVAPTPPAAAVADPSRPAPWTVQLGDHLWSIAEQTLREATGTRPGEADVARYWRDLVVANGELVDADLIFPGQTIVRPPLP